MITSPIYRQVMPINGDDVWPIHVEIIRRLSPYSGQEAAVRGRWLEHHVLVSLFTVMQLLLPSGLLIYDNVRKSLVVYLGLLISHQNV